MRKASCWSGDGDTVRVTQVAHGFHVGDFVGYASAYDQPGYWGPPVRASPDYGGIHYPPPGLCTDEATGAICAFVDWANFPIHYHWIGWKREGDSYAATTDTASRWILLHSMRSAFTRNMISRTGCVAFVESADKFTVRVGNRHAWSHMPADPMWSSWCTSLGSLQPAWSKGQAADVCSADYVWRENRDAADTYRELISPSLSPWGNPSLEWLHNYYRGVSVAQTGWRCAGQYPPCVLGYPPADAVPINGALFCVDPDAGALYVIWNTAVGGVRIALVDAGTVYLEAARPYWVDANISWMWLYLSVVFGGAWRAPPMGSEGWAKRWFCYSEEYYS